MSNEMLIGAAATARDQQKARQSSDAATPSTSTPLVSIVVMAFNEAGSVVGVLDEIDDSLRGILSSYEVIIVDDGSTDATGQIAAAAVAGSPHRRVIRHEVNLGIGEVYRSGFGMARGELLTFLPADGQFPATSVARFVSLMSEADLVLGRLPPVKRDALSVLLSRLERLFYRVLFGPLPEFQGIMMFRRELLPELDVAVGGRGWGVLMEIVIKSTRAGKVVRSEVTPLRPRYTGRSKVKNLRTVWANVMQGLSLWRRLHSPASLAPRTSRL